MCNGAFWLNPNKPINQKAPGGIDEAASLSVWTESQLGVTSGGNYLTD